jgi:hypothetical protein
MVCSLGRRILSASTMRFLSGSCHPDNHAEGREGDVLRARDNPGYCVTWANARRRLLTCAVG